MAARFLLYKEEPSMRMDAGNIAYTVPIPPGVILEKTFPFQ